MKRLLCGFFLLLVLALPLKAGRTCNGTSDLITILNTLGTPTNFTISFWYSDLGGININGRMLQIHNASHSEEMYYTPKAQLDNFCPAPKQNSAPVYYATLAGSGGSQTPLPASAPFTDCSPPAAPVWSHFAYVRTGTTVTIWREGVLSPTTITVGSGAVSSLTENTLCQENGVFWNGNIAEFSFVNAALSGAQIVAMSRGARITQVGIPQANIIVYQPETGYSSPEPDWSGNGHSGTLTGTSNANSHPPIAPPVIVN